MQNNMIQVFENADFGKLIILMIDGKPHFNAGECAKALGYLRPNDAIHQHCRYTVKHRIPHPQSPNKTIQVNFIPEGDLYRLIIRSKLPTAIDFEKWVFDTVLPSIRKYGAYVSDDVLDQLIENPETATKLFAKLKSERSKKEALEKYVEILTPKARYNDIVLQSPGNVLTTVVAKDYAMSATKFNRLLHSLEVQFRHKTNSTWFLYEKHEGKGYTDTITRQINGVSCVLMVWTQKGRAWLYEYLKAHGVYPKAEQPVQLELTEPPAV